MGKKLDLIHYYDRVKQFCCYQDITSTERQNILQMPITFNAVLDPEFKIRFDESDTFIEYYVGYRNWLLEKYIDPSFSFQARYPNCFSRKQRKHWNIKKFEEIYGSVSREKLFFAQTFSDYSTICNYPFRVEPLPNTIYKMRLGALCMLQVIGYHNDYFDFEIRDLKRHLSPPEEATAPLPQP